MPLCATEWVLFNGKLPNQGSYTLLCLQLIMYSWQVCGQHGTYGIVISERGSSFFSKYKTLPNKQRLFVSQSMMMSFLSSACHVWVGM